MEIVYKEDKVINKEDLIELYTDAGWTKYVSNTDKLLRAFENSILVISAWEKDNLVGLVRAVGDGETILYIQDLLINSSAKRKGIGTKLMNMALYKYPDVRQKVLITDDNPETNGFYRKVGYKESEKLSIKAFVNFSD
ncbi:MAG: GNAT family N-acetyltransferase [Clostridia bacterium]